MKHILFTLIVALPASWVFADVSEPAAFAVVELFTSEGCSSCPPAERLLASIADQARQDSEAIYTLAFHVDYWDRLGWVGRYSSKRHSQRQAHYAEQHIPTMHILGATASRLVTDD